MSGLQMLGAALEGGKLKESELPPSVVSSSLKALGEVTGATKLNFSNGTFQTATLKGATTFSVENAPSRPAVLELLVNTGTGFTFSVEGINWLGSEPAFSSAAGLKYLVTLLLLEGTVYGVVGLQGKAGEAGSNGNTIRNKAGAPEAAEGVNGDFCIDTTGHKIYGPKTAGAWGSGTSIVGETGATGATGAAGPESFNPARKLLLPTAWPVYAGTGASTTENKLLVAESMDRALAGQALLLESGIPVIAAIPVAAKQVITGVAFGITTAEGTPANRTHFWVALLNSAGEVKKVSADYTSSTNTPLGTGTRRGLKFTSTYEVGSENTFVYAVICEVMSSTAPITIPQREGVGFMVSATPAVGAKAAAQTTPEAFTGTISLVETPKTPYLGLF